MHIDRFSENINYSDDIVNRIPKELSNTSNIEINDDDELNGIKKKIKSLPERLQNVVMYLMDIAFKSDISSEEITDVLSEFDSDDLIKAQKIIANVTEFLEQKIKRHTQLN
jgi:DNA-directed RNA polymerase specialized sigma subunit